ncbi:MAG: response regulator [Elusimicrobia bacterium]|nr:response regulator [Elusimicrobiota bacterium]
MGTTKKRLLIVEDDPNLMDLMTDYCEEIDVIALAAVDGKSALAKAANDRPDVITVDYRLPDMSGVEVIAHLKSDPRVSGIPVILLSADAKIHENEAKARGAFGVLMKPVSPGALRAMMEECVGDW